jgi:hypothetical protein
MNGPASSVLPPYPPWLSADEGQLRTPAVQRLAKVLEKYDRQQVVSLVAGMLTVPNLQANCYRLELLVQLAVANCNGKLKPTKKHLSNWLNRQLGTENVAWMEDPPEDVFVSNVITKTGDYLVLGGMWEVPDAASTLLIQCVEQHGGEEQLQWLHPVYALLQLSDLVLKRAKLARWVSEPSTPKRLINLAPTTPVDEWRSRVVITRSDLIDARIKPELLDEFVLSAEDSATLMQQSNQESTLHAKPLLRFGEHLLLATPTSITYAVRRYLVRRAAAASQLDPLQDSLMRRVMSRANQVMRRGSNHGVTLVQLPSGLAGRSGLYRSFVYGVGQRRFIHLLVLSDSLEQFASTGLLRPTEFSDEDEALILAHVAHLREHVEATNQVDSGHTLVLLGHLGQAYMLAAPQARPSWTFDLCRLDSLELLLQDSDAPLDKLILLLTQRAAMEKQGLYLRNVNGLLNLYAYWVEHGYNLRMLDIPHDQSGHLRIATDHVMAFRRTRRQEADKHCEITAQGASVYVLRANSDSVYDSVRSIPAYGSIPHLEAGHLSFALRRNETAVWVTMLSPSSDAGLRDLSYRLWEGLQLILYRALEMVEPSITFSESAVEVIVDVRAVVAAPEAQDTPSLPDDIAIGFHRALPVAKLTLGAGFLRSFSGIENRGEQTLLSRLISALRVLANQNGFTEGECDDDALKVLGSKDAKILHMFEMVKPLDYILAKDQRRVFRMPGEHVDAAMRSAFNWMKSSAEKLVLDKDSSCRALNTAVTRLMEQVTVKLARFNRSLLIAELLHAQESLLRDKDRWRSTARAVRALYGIDSGTDAAARMEKERSQATLTLRVLVEAAVCECPVTGGAAPDGHSIDEVFGLMWTLIQLGRDSETIYHDLASEGITIYPNGAYNFNADVLTEIGGPYAMESFRTNYEAAATDYENWITPKEKGTGGEVDKEFVSASYRAAFLAEYRLESGMFLEIIGALLDTVVEGESVVVSLSRDEIVGRCLNRGVNGKDVDAFLSSFALPSRPTWVPQKPWAEPKDVEPWRFERRLSVMLRPLVECAGTGPVTYVFGAAALRQSIGYILDSTIKGRFDKDVFLSPQMRSYIGRRVDALGAAFTQLVAQKLREQGWTVRTEVKMSALGAGKYPNLGDIDVLAWSPAGKVLAIECKRLKTARTIAEVAQTCARFKGNSGDQLYKHLRRIGWLQNNKDKLARFIGMSEDHLALRAPLVTSAPVPFRYVRGLALARKDIWPFTLLSAEADRT